MKTRIPLHFRDATIILLGLGVFESKSSVPWNSLNSTLNKHSDVFFRLAPGKPVYGLVELIPEYEKQSSTFGGLPQYAQFLSDFSPSQIDILNGMEPIFPYIFTKTYQLLSSNKHLAPIEPIPFSQITPPNTSKDETDTGQSSDSSLNQQQNEKPESSSEESHPSASHQ